MTTKAKVKAVVGLTLRRVGLFEFADNVRGKLHNRSIKKQIIEFEKQNPHFVLPPSDLAYDAYRRWTPESYRNIGFEHAKYLAGLIKRHQPGVRSVAEWGCGPMRILRHMSSLLPGVRLVGLDYNPDTIAWAKNQPEFNGIELHRNDLRPPLPLPDGEIDAIYNLSVFTHLSDALHHAYIRDLQRCLAPGGILISTFQGDWYKSKLSPAELQLYEQGKIVVRDQVMEGKRGYAAFHPPAFVRRLLENWEILEHIESPDVAGLFQDVWVARKPA
ncbi:bifunctional 2-polyprenyl-6-hydroxyphenol methylase/3-demethylubiquinol 3-O-methyltransferase UbiG [Inquilinus sp. Marseille-Q2685]|uniref:class I SAM-dependent methyltransferase n=1 Tax=Inquilinus sp. Marseille-Q2685 TaxID=2866581 RepID=UPI001CE3B704|nr:class I SAM-dependent methyltransferase [Inquilinus sp. Marseille-Q2685]